MDNAGDFSESPGQAISECISFLVHFRGMKAEKELLEAFGELRIVEIYEGDEPRITELVKIAEILGFPLSTFIEQKSGVVPDLEIAWAQILYHIAGKPPDERDRFIQKVLALIESESGDGEIVEIANRMQQGQ